MRRAGGTLMSLRFGIQTPRRLAASGGTMSTVPVRTPHGLVDVDPDALELGELVVSDDGVELEVVSLEPLRFEPAPQEDEDWGE
jgi:lysine biosynthesis protein LysW